MKVIQISDMHLFADDEADIFGVKTNMKFKEVIERIFAEDMHDADMIFITGDMSQDETRESYHKIVQLLLGCHLPIYWIPGNHDDLIKAEAVFLGVSNFHNQTKLSLPHWHFIFLNTTIAGRDDGELSVSELDMLEKEILASPANKQIAIIMHHHPTPVNTPLVDNYILKNTEDFWGIVNETGVELVICGHVHGDYQIKHNNVMIETSPATCLQWEKGATDLKKDLRIGYKLYHFEQGSYKAITKMW